MNTNFDYSTSKTNRTAAKDKVEQLLRNLETAHNTYYDEGIFHGPSLFFHLEALRAGHANDFERFSEMAYAMLAAWGMHRMGRGGSKMTAFSAFQESLKPQWPLVLSLQEVKPADLNEEHCEKIRLIFCNIRCWLVEPRSSGTPK